MFSKESLFKTLSKIKWRNLFAFQSFIFALYADISSLLQFFEIHKLISHVYFYFDLTNNYEHT